MGPPQQHLGPDAGFHRPPQSVARPDRPPSALGSHVYADAGHEPALHTLPSGRGRFPGRQALAEQTIELVQIVVVCRRTHSVTAFGSCLSVCRNWATARRMRDLTVPNGRPVFCAISS